MSANRVSKSMKKTARKRTNSESQEELERNSASNTNSNHEIEPRAGDRNIKQFLPSTSEKDEMDKTFRHKRSRSTVNIELVALSSQQTTETRASKQAMKTASTRFEEGDNVMDMMVDPSDNFISDDKNDSNNQSDQPMNGDSDSLDGEYNEISGSVGNQTDDEWLLNDSFPHTNDNEQMKRSQDNTPVKKKKMNRESRSSMENKIDNGHC